MASVAVVTVPSVPTAMGSTVGTVTDMAVAAGSPVREPSTVEDRLTEAEAESPEAEMSVPAAEAKTVKLKTVARARQMAMSFLQFFMVTFLLF